jgi:hypothetical protein
MSQYDRNDRPTLRFDIRMLLPMAGILFAPFVGYLFSPNFGLGILVVCLSVVAWMTWGLVEQVPPPQARTLRIGAVLNAAMAVAALGLLIYRI